MIKKGNLIRGIICIIIALLYGINAYLYHHYYMINRPTNEQNEREVNLFGPTPIVINEILIQVCLFILYVALTIIFGLSAITQDNLDKVASHVCKDYVGINAMSKNTLNYIKNKLK